MARVYSNTASIIQMAVVGEGKPAITTPFYTLSEIFSRRRFMPIDETAEEISEGWVETDNTDEGSFASPGTLMRDHYLFFSLRRDQRKIPGAALKARIVKAEKEVLEANPTWRRIPKTRREEIRENVRGQMLASILPSPDILDAVWDMNTSIITIFTGSIKTVDRFETLFKKSFEGLRLQLIHPYARGVVVLGADSDILAALNQSGGSEADLDLIKGNAWIGSELLAWVLDKGVNGGGESAISAHGPLPIGDKFTSWVDDRIEFAGGGGEGPQKVVVSGSQDKYEEAKSAFRTGKEITSATVYLEHQENLWRVKIGAEYFIFGSFKCPSVKIEKEVHDGESEREAVFYERMYLVESGLQMFDSLLEKYLRTRSGAWDTYLRDFVAWLASE